MVMSFSEIQEFPRIEEFLIVLINGPINVLSLQLSGDNLSLPAREISEQRRQLLGGMCGHFLKIQNIENGHHSTNQVTDNRFRRAKKLNNPNGGGTLIQLSALKTAVAISKNYIYKNTTFQSTQMLSLVRSKVLILGYFYVMLTLTHSMIQAGNR